MGSRRFQIGDEYPHWVRDADEVPDGVDWVGAVGEEAQEDEAVEAAEAWEVEVWGAQA